MAEQEVTRYSTEDVIKSVNKLLKYSEAENINPALFLHSLIFTSELLIKRFSFVPKQVAEIRRQSRHIIDHIDEATKSTPKKE